jgi:hypothetical protein
MLPAVGGGNPETFYKRGGEARGHTTACLAHGHFSISLPLREIRYFGTFNADFGTVRSLYRQIRAQVPYRPEAHSQPVTHASQNIYQITLANHYFYWFYYFPVLKSVT